MNSFSLEIEHLNFSGPIELLYDLIEKKKVYVHEVSLSDVVDEFIQYVRSLHTLPIEDTAHFISVASTLLLIKSRSLLPDFSLTEEEETSIGELERQVALHGTMKALLPFVKELWDTTDKKRVYASLPRPIHVSVFAPHPLLTLSSIVETRHRLEFTLPKKEKRPSAHISKKITLEEMVLQLTERIQKALSFNFSEYASSHGGAHAGGSKIRVRKEERYSIIVSFLALLELVKSGTLHATQESRAHDITIETHTPGTPHYS